MILALAAAEKNTKSATGREGNVEDSHYYAILQQK